VASGPDEKSKGRPARRLAAILAADVAGFSRLMGIDERGTYERLKALRLGIVDPAVAEHAGRIVKLMGDGLLVEFGSAVNAVECATAIQRGMATSHGDLPLDRRIRVRIGINLGDIIVEGRDIYGDGVNVAARIEALAPPGGIAISEDLRRHVRNKIEIPFEDLGERRLKNIAEPVRIYQIPASFFAPAALAAVGKERVPALTASPTVPEDKPSIVVLPLENMSDDPGQAYFSDGIAEDIITDLSKISGLFVIARNTAFTYRGRALNLKEVCGELGVRFALEGSVRRAGNRVRITAQLIDGISGGHVWAERYDRDLHDIFEVQDEVTREIVAALKVHLTPDERRLAQSRGTNSIEAYDRFLRGRQLFWQTSRETIERAQALFEEAIRLDPAFSLAHAYLAFTHALQSINRWSPDLERSFELAQGSVDRALALDPKEAEAHYVQGIIHLWRHRKVDEAIADGEQAIALDPNFARGYGSLGAALHYAGRSEEALQRLETMARLDPHTPGPYQHFWAQAHFALGHFDDAVALLKVRLARQPHSDVSRVLLAACYGHLGQAEAARSEWAEALLINPDYSLEERRRILPYKNPADFERVVEGLRKAGIAV
jgi:adenylate cyclase